MEFLQEGPIDSISTSLLCVLPRPCLLAGANPTSLQAWTSTGPCAAALSSQHRPQGPVHSSAGMQGVAAGSAAVQCLQQSWCWVPQHHCSRHAASNAGSSSTLAW
uniref:Uncharacterized protein n=1 Tax=Tetradesmus obliquus TaxID=3088 RepID=A0A383WI67_TETOB